MLVILELATIPPEKQRLGDHADRMIDSAFERIIGLQPALVIHAQDSQAQGKK